MKKIDDEIRLNLKKMGITEDLKTLVDEKEQSLIKQVQVLFDKKVAGLKFDKKSISKEISCSRRTIYYKEFLNKYIDYLIQEYDVGQVNTVNELKEEVKQLKRRLKKAEERDFEYLSLKKEYIELKKKYENSKERSVYINEKLN